MKAEPVEDIELEELIIWLERGESLGGRWDIRELIKRLALALKRSRLGKGVY